MGWGTHLKRLTARTRVLVEVYTVLYSSSNVRHKQSNKMNLLKLHNKYGKKKRCPNICSKYGKAKLLSFTVVYQEV